MKKVTQKLKENTASTEMIASVFTIIVLIAVLSYSMTILGEIGKIDNLQQMAQQMARAISLEGAVNSNIDIRLDTLENTFGLEVDMDVDGDYISGNKLRTESDFKVTIIYNSKYGFGGVINQTNTKTYRAVAHGTVEEYHK